MQAQKKCSTTPLFDPSVLRVGKKKARKLDVVKLIVYLSFDTHLKEFPIVALSTLVAVLSCLSSCSSWSSSAMLEVVLVAIWLIYERRPKVSEVIWGCGWGCLGSSLRGLKSLPKFPTAHRAWAAGVRVLHYSRRACYYRNSKGGGHG